MKILIITSMASTLIKFRKEFILYLLDNNIEVILLAPDFTSYIRDYFKSVNVCCISYRSSRGSSNPIRDIQTFLDLRRLIKSNKPDIVFSYFMKPVIYGSLASRSLGPGRTVGMLEGLGYVYTANKYGYSAKKKLLQFFNGILLSLTYFSLNRLIFLNNDDYNDVSKKSLIGKSKISVLGPIGLELDDYPYSILPPVIDSKVVFLFAARLLAEKGIYEFVNAAKYVKVKYPNTEFIVLGELDSENPSSLSRNELTKLVNNNVITYPGFVNNVYDYIKNSHVFVLPSYREGIPRTIQEAMAIGRPVIASDVPGCRDIVQDGVNGYIVPPYSSESLATKMEFMIQNPALMRTMGDASYNYAKENFNVHSINPNLRNLIFDSKL